MGKRGDKKGLNVSFCYAIYTNFEPQPEGNNLKTEFNFKVFASISKVKLTRPRLVLQKH